MKIDWNHPVVFVCVFLSIQGILCISEANTYSDMVSDIQSSKANYNTLHWLFNLVILYPFLSIFIYYYIVHPKKSYIEGFIFICVLYSFWDIAIYSLFDKGPNYIPILAYDVLIVGGFNLIAAMFILNNYYYILKSYTVPLCILAIVSIAWLQYKLYKHNPDLSKLTVAHSLGLTR